MKNVFLKDICTPEKGKQIDTNLLNDNNKYKYINGGVKESGYYSKYNTQGGVVIVSEGGASCGFVNFIRDPFWCGCHCYKLMNSKLKPLYLYYLLKGNQAKIMALRTGAAMPNIKKSSFEKLSLNVDFDEGKQRVVIDCLSQIEEAIKDKQNQLSLLDELIKSRFIEMFGTIDLSEERPNWIGLEKLAKVYTGTTPSSSDETNWNGDILWITPAEMKSNSFYIYDTVRKITEKGRKSKSLEIMPVNTVLLSTRAPIGKVGIVGKPMTCNQGFKNFWCGPKLNPVFLYTLFKNNVDYLNSLGSGTTFLEISKSRISKLKVPVPPIELQNKFAAFVEQVDKSKFVAQQQIKDLQELLDKKMDEYFSE